MTEQEALEEKQALHALRASHTSNTKAIEALMICLPYAQQRFVLQYLEAEAIELEQSFGSSSSEQVREAVALQATSMRSMARRLERLHLSTMQTQWAEAASRESAALKGQ